jgi:hypothetical protein
MENNKAPEEVLREQLALLAERSKDCSDDFLLGITTAMVEIYNMKSECG